MGWMVPQIDKFPRVRRHSLGAQIETGLLFVLERLVEATYTKARLAALRAANLKLEVVRHLWRLAFELQAVSIKSWEHGAGLLIELGRQVGGWAKASEP
jgi:hypothetical protein